MRNFYVFRKLPCFCLIAISLLIAEVSAQNAPAVHQGIIRIKLQETAAAYLQSTPPSRTSQGYLHTGNTAFDQALLVSKATTIERVFRQAGKFESKHRKHGLHLWYEVHFDETEDVKQVVSRFEALSDVLHSEPIYEKTIEGYDKMMSEAKVGLSSSPDDFRYADQWHYNNTGQTGGTPGADIKLLAAWSIETGNSDIIVAVTDGGIDTNHEDLAANIWVNVNEIPDNGIDDDNNGYIDDIYGYGFGDNTGIIPANFHGTHVGGTIAAVTNNGKGVAGVAGGDGSGNGVRLMSLAAFGATGTGGFAETYVYAADNGAVISQNSWGYTSPGVYDQAVLDAIDYFIAEAGYDAMGNPDGPMQGGLVIFAAGNSASAAEYYPGFYDPVLAVGGTDHNDNQYVSSNRGDWVDVAAPAVNVLSTFPNNQYSTISGTSMACPHVSGLAALIISKNTGNITPDQVRSRILQTADPLPGLEFLGTGRINAFAALQQDDKVPPERIADLSVAETDLSSVTLAWTAPSDQGNGSAAVYDIRYATAPITSNNFDDATPVENPLKASLAGVAESYTITGLTPDTEYFFAVLSEDFFANRSGISNVVSATTDHAPIASVSPNSLTADLKTGRNETKILTIANSGQGSLEFNLSFGGTAFIPTLSTADGVVGEGGSQDISITFDASGLLGGTYENEILIKTNDPENSNISVPITMIVTGTGKPVITVAPESLEFEDVLQGGSGIKMLKISNEGTETLVVSHIYPASDVFAVTSQTAFDLNPFESIMVTVNFSPTSLGEMRGEIVILSNDIAAPELPVAVSGTGVEAPAIAVSPTSIEVDLETGHTTTKALNITNNGLADLDFTIAINAPGGESSSISMEFPAKDSHSLEEGKDGSLDNFSGMSILSSVSLSAKKISVLLLSPDADISDLFNALSAFPDLDVTRLPKSKLPTISLADVEGYDVMMTTNNYQWLGAGGVDPAVIGDLLADYIDQGGKVITNNFANDYDAWALKGRFVAEGYGPFTVSSSDFSGSVHLGTVHKPSHPIMENVSAIGNSFLHQDPGLAAGANLLADWSNGNHFVATNENVVALNILPSRGGGVPGWTGDLPTLYHNAIIWLRQSAFVFTDVKFGTLRSGESKEVIVSLSAENLEAGLYKANIDINSNDPVNSIVQVPVSLNVLAPTVTATPEFLDITVIKGYSESRPITLDNNGTLEAEYVIEVVNGEPGSQSENSEKIIEWDSVSMASSFEGIIPVASSITIEVEFDAAELDIDTYYRDILIYINGASEPSIVIPAVYHVIGVPEIEVSPASLEVELVAGFSSRQILSITNNGLGVLKYQFDDQESIPFLSAKPGSGDIEVGETVEVEVTFDAADLEKGVYQDDMSISSNDPNTPAVHIPVLVEVINPPSMAIASDTVISNVILNRTKDHRVTITNTGEANLRFGIVGYGDAPEPGVFSNSINFNKEKQAKIEYDKENSKDPQAPSSVTLTDGEQLLFENFEGGTFPPDGWAVVDNEGTRIVWQSSATNYTGGTGKSAFVNSDLVGTAEFDTELITPVVDIQGKSGVVVKYFVNYQNFASRDFLDLDISTDGGISWVNVLRWNEDHGSFFRFPGEFVTVPLDHYLKGASTMMLRWHYYDPGTNDIGWYAQIDDVEIIYESISWLTVDPGQGMVPGGESMDVTFTFDARYVGPGEYVNDLLLLTNVPTQEENALYVEMNAVRLEPLALTSICSDNPDKQRGWSVHNPNDVEVEAYWFVTESNLEDSLTVVPGENIFYTQTIDSDNNSSTLNLKWLDENHEPKEVSAHSGFDPCKIKALDLTSICSNNPERIRNWRINNPNTFGVIVEWVVTGNTTQQGSFRAETGDTFFSTEAVFGPNTTRIGWVHTDGETHEVVKASGGEVCDIDNSCTGAEVIAFAQGLRKNATKVLRSRSNSRKSLGMPEEHQGINFVSLGFGGSIVIKLGNIVVDQPGNDFKVFETSYNDIRGYCAEYPETADVYVSDTGDEFYFVGVACKDTEFDISVSHLDQIQYVKIVDTSDVKYQGFGSSADGFDLDGIHCINAHYSEARKHVFGLANTIPDEDLISLRRFYPNPFSDKITIDLAVEQDGAYNIIMHNTKGELIYKGTGDAIYGELKVEIITKELVKGSYTISISSHDENFKETGLLVKQ